MEVCVVAFKNNISERVAKLLPIKNKYYLISTHINPGLESINASGIGNSYCNLLSYLMASKNQNYAFIHIPKNFDIEIAVREIKVLCESVYL